MKHVCVLAALWLSAGCSPYVGTTILSSHPPLADSVSVAVIEEGSPVPEEARMIGTFNVGDNGFAANCTYEDVLRLAQRKARKAGGNMIRVTQHLYPSIFGSSCHRIKGDILYYDAEGGYSGYAQAQPVLDYAAQQPAAEVLLPAGKWRFGVDAGYSYRTAKIVEGVNYDLRNFLNKMRNGVYYGLDVHHFSENDFGIGARITGRHYAYTQGGLGEKVDTYYIAPSMMWRVFDRRGRNAWTYGFSLGYIHLNDRLFVGGAQSGGINKGGVGSSVDLGYDIRLGEGTSFLGLRFAFSGGSIYLDPNEETAGNKEIKGESLAAVEFGVGLRF